jgi:hypothetical protein
MRKMMILLAVAAAPALAPQIAMADPAPAQVRGNDQNVTVQANRPICRRATRTASRMGSGTVCHTAEEWQRLGVRMTNSNTTIDDASQTLDTVGQGSTTGDSGGMGGPH